VGPGSLGTLQESVRGLTHLLIAIDKFTKWIEARPLAKIVSKQTMSFVEDIIFCFVVPNSIITTNNTQFTTEKFLDFCDDGSIWVDWTVVTHPRMNKQVKRANGLIL
jgi:hypothetical protein